MVTKETKLCYLPVSLIFDSPSRPLLLSKFGGEE